MSDSSEVAVTGHHQFALCESIMLAACAGSRREREGGDGEERDREVKDIMYTHTGCTDHKKYKPSSMLTDINIPLYTIL